MRRVERLFAIAEALRARRSGVTAEALATRFGVAPRTIYRDLDSLRAAQLPLTSERGRGGGYALDRSYSLPPVNFSAREAALLLSLGEWAKASRLLPFTRSLSSALDKVEGALPRASRAELKARIGQLGFVGVPKHALAPGVEEAIERAWFDGLPLRIRYRRANGASTVRTVRIVNVVIDLRETRINTIDLESNEARQFHLDRIESAELDAVAESTKAE